MKVVSMEKSFGDLFLQHGGQYTKTGVKSSTRVGVGMPDGEAEYWHTFDSANSLMDNKDATSLFTGFSIVKIPANKAPSADSVINQTAITVTKTGVNKYTISADWSTLKKYLSTEQAWQSVGPQAWVGMIVSTGVDITTLKFNGVTLGAADVQEVQAYGGSTGDFALWTYVKEGATIFTLSKGSDCAVIEINFVNTAA